jgi:hypothetical protein
MTIATAEQVLRELGPEAVEAVKDCVENCRRLGDELAAKFWQDVERQLVSMVDDDRDGLAEARDQRSSDVYFRRRRWMLMQKAEAYRQRAMNAERSAGGGSEHNRQDMIDIAMQWFELARQYDWLASDL